MKHSAQVLLALALAGCSHMPNPRPFSDELAENNPNANMVRCTNPAPSHLLWARYCDVERFSRESYALARGHSRAADARNVVTFAAGTYVASTLALNAGALSGDETSDLGDTAVGMAILGASSQLYNPTYARQTHLRESRAYRCVADAAHRALQREARIVNLEAAIPSFQDNIAGLSALLENPNLDNETIRTRARETLAAANGALTRAGVEIGAYRSFPDELIAARDAIHDAVVDRSLANEITYAELMTAIQASIEANLAFNAVKEPPAPVEEPGTQVSEGDTANERASKLADTLSAQTTRIQNLTPNVSGLGAHLQQCPTIVGTGVAVPRPQISEADIGAEPPTDGTYFQQTHVIVAAPRTPQSSPAPQAPAQDSPEPDEAEEDDPAADEG